MDTRALTRDLTALEKDQLPFATSLAINRTALDIQRAVRTSMLSSFTIAPDRKRFMDMMVRFDRKNYATKTNLEARIGVNDTESPAAGEGRDRSFILGRHETGGVRRAPDPLRPFAIPTRALRAGAFDVPPRSLYPSSLRLVERRTPSGTLPAKSRVTKRGKIMIQGKRGTFVMDAGTGVGNPKVRGVWQRTGPGKRDIRMLWMYRDRISLRPRLRFYETGQRVIDTQFARIFERAMDEAVRTAR